MANDVRDEHRSPIEPDAGKELVEELACGADERLALEVLVIAGRFTEEEDPGVSTAVSGDCLPCAAMQRARGASADLVGDEPEIGRGVVQRADYAAGEGFRGAFRAR